jgi:hypothetical protein
MANVFKNSITGSIGTNGVIAYQVPPATTTTVIGVNLANVASQNISVSVMARDSSSDKTVYLIKDALIVQGGTSVLIGGEQKLVLETNDFLTVTSSLANSADVIVSVLELT